MVALALVGCALVAYWAGARAQRYRQARADVRDNRVKLRKARAARPALRTTALIGWLALAAVLAIGAVISGALSTRR